MDVHVPAPIGKALRLRSVDVLTAQEDGAAELTDAALLDRSTALGRVLFTRDEDFLAETARRQRFGIPFGGVIYAHQLLVTIGQCVNDLELIAQVYSMEEVAERVFFLPLK